MREDKAIQKRINPKPWVERPDFPCFGRVIGGTFLVIGTIFAIAGVIVISESLVGAIFLLLGCSAILVGTYLLGGGVPPWEWLPVIVNSRVWRRSQTTAQATILDYERKSHKDYDGNVYYTHWVVLGFDTVKEEITLRARVSRPYTKGTTLEVRYAAEKPCVALLEGEFEDHPEPARRRARKPLRQSLIELGESARDGHIVNILLLIGLPFLGFGVWLSFFAAPDNARDAQRVKHASVLEMADFQNVEPGEDVVLAGTLGDTPGPKPINQIADRAARQGLVVYLQQRWDCERDDDGFYDGNWEGADRVVPEVITIDDREVSIALAQSADMNGERFYSPVILEGDGRLCDGQREGSIRVVGYRAGDQIIAFGRKGIDGRLIVERWYGGNRDLFISGLERAARSSRRWGLILLGAGLLSELVWLGIFLSPRFLQRPWEHVAYLKRRTEVERQAAVDMLNLAQLLSGLMLVCLVAGIIVVIVVGIEIVEANPSQQWPSINGEIASTGFERRMTVGDIRYCLDVSYQYTVNNRRYTSSRIKPHSLCYETTVDAIVALQAYPEGSAVTVYYNPKNPDRALLDRTVDYVAFYLGWAVLGMAGMIFGLVWLIRRSAAKATGKATPWRETIFWLKIIPGLRS